MRWLWLWTELSGKLQEESIMEIELSDNEETQEFTITAPNGRGYTFQVSASGNNLDLWIVWPSADDSSYVFVQTATNAVQVVPE